MAKYMTEYIDKEKAIYLVEKAVSKADAMMALLRMNPADAVPVRHGRWVTDGMMMDDGDYLMTRCTECGEAYEYGYNMPFCPMCGADMRKDGGNG